MATRAYERHRAQTAARQRDLATAGRDIGPIPPIRDPTRRAAATRSLATFCVEYLDATFYLPWSSAHLTAIDRLERAARHGGLFCFAMPRGFGKTSLCWSTALWAMLGGSRPFVALIGADEPAAAQLLSAIKTQLQHNAHLLADWPEVCYPISKLDGISQRAHGQLYRGRSTALSWTANSITLPSIPGSRAAGATVRVAGITGRIRGMAHTTPDGRTIRPSLVILDDPQTDESARSPSQCQTRSEIISGAVLNLAGPGVPIAAAMPCTVIRREDLADRFLDRNAQPDWQGERTRAVQHWPTRDDLWQQYARLRTEDLKSGGNGAPATEFYRDHREEMDAGATVTWPAQHGPDTLSALQHHYNLKLRDPTAYAAEHDNDPLDTHGDLDTLTAEDILTRPGGYKPGAIPDPSARHLGMMTDVHDSLLYWAIVAASDDFTAWVIDYGCWPDQRRSYYTLRDATRTLGRLHPKAGKDGAIVAGLKELLDEKLSMTLPIATGGSARIDIALSDAGYKPDAVDLAIRTSRHPAAGMASKGLPIGAANKPMSEYQRHPGDVLGHYWRTTYVGTRKRRQVQFDANYWKSHLLRSLTTAPGDPGALYLPDCDRQLLADHLTAEYPVRTTARGRTVDQWMLKPNRDNHLLDCVVGALVACAMRGATPPGLPTAKKRRRRPRVRYTH